MNSQADGAADVVRGHECGRRRQREQLRRERNLAAAAVRNAKETVLLRLQREAAANRAELDALRTARLVVFGSGADAPGADSRGPRVDQRTLGKFFGARSTPYSSALRGGRWSS